MESLDGLICLVTGANSGIGKATAEALVRRGAHVILVCRRPDAGEEARAALDALPSGSAELLVADLSDPDAIASAAATVAARHGRVDRLINNAGAYFPRRVETVDGLEACFATNHLGPFRLTRHLLPLIPEDGRIVVLSSRSHKEGRLDLSDPQRTRRPYLGYAAYSDSKLANILFVRELAKRLGPGPTINAVHPGVIATGFARDEPGFLNRLIRVGALFMRGPAYGARGPLRLATDPKLASTTGQYFSVTRHTSPSSRAQDSDLSHALWELSESLSPGLPPVPMR